MTKAELVNEVAQKADITKAKAEKAVNAVFEALAESLKKKERTIIPGFGTFTVSKRKERKGRNPQTGKEIMIPAKTVAVFRPAKELKSL